MIVLDRWHYIMMHTVILNDDNFQVIAWLDTVPE